MTFCFRGVNIYAAQFRKIAADLFWLPWAAWFARPDLPKRKDFRRCNHPGLAVLGQRVAQPLWTCLWLAQLEDSRNAEAEC